VSAERDLLVRKASDFRDLHRGRLLVIPNAWDAASARSFEGVGFSAIATTSGGIAAVLGYGDHEQAPVEEMLNAVLRISRAVAVPVTADLEAGYGFPPAELARRAIAVGVVGVNLEDTDHRRGVLVEPHQQAERLAAFRDAARAEGVDLFLNARVDVFLRGGAPDAQLAEAVRRARLYAEAGADCVYPLGIEGDEPIAAFVRAVGIPVNVRAADGVPPLARLAELGVRRVTYATRLARRVFAMTDALAAEIRASIPEQV
jgi:2-methylisocitrate lyase-like PEP mutase family enzyme